MIKRLYTVFLLIVSSALPPLVRAEEVKLPESITLITRIPPVVRGGDLFKGGVAVMNNSDRNLDIDISGIMKGYENNALNSRRLRSSGRMLNSCRKAPGVVNM